MPNTRTNDPITSHLAAKSVRHLTETQKAIMRILWRKQMNDVDLVNAYNAQVNAGKAPMASQSGIRSRRAELVERGFIAPTGRLEKLATGRMAIIWKPIRRVAK
jgi:hypothetical protein